MSGIEMAPQPVSLPRQGGRALIRLAGSHAAAALVHHFVLRDGLLRGMLPSRAGRAR